MTLEFNQKKSKMKNNINNRFKANQRLKTNKQC